MLNALRHQRLGQHKLTEVTPVHLGAQRLTASKVGTEAFSVQKMDAIFGGAQRLTASKVGTVDPACTSPQEESVLNALRHQRLGQRRLTGLQIVSRGSAQRLTASKVGTESKTLTTLPRLRGAQRLTASKVGTGRIARPLGGLYLCRAQRLTASKVGTD